MGVSQLIIEARFFATGAHAAVNQRRKYTDEPYIVHPAAVARLVALVRGTEEMIAAAWLHDVVEDTGVTLGLIEQIFGTTVAQYVGEVTDVSKPEDGNRAERKRLDREHIARASPQGKTIKLADMIDNAGSIMTHDPEFAKVYLQEKKETLIFLKEGSPDLYRRLEDIV